MYQGIHKYKVTIITPQNRKVTRFLKGIDYQDIKKQLEDMKLKYIGNFEYICNNDQSHHIKKHRRIKGKYVYLRERGGTARRPLPLGRG